MSPWFSVAHPRGSALAQPPRRASRRLRGLSFVAGLLVVGASVGYLMQANAIAAAGYRIEKLQRRVNELKLQTRDLEGDVLQLQSAESVTRRIQQLQLVPAGEAQYLTGLTPVAANR